MNVQFVNQFVKSALSLPHCPCQKDLMETLSGDIQSPETNLKRIQDLIRSSPTDLKIISEDGKVIHSHKLLFGLIISNLAKILLEDDFIGEHVTVFIPLRSAVLVKVIEEGGNWIEIQSILSTCEDDHHQYQNPKPTNSISITKLKKEETELGMPSEKKRKNFQTSVKIPTYPTLLTTFLTIFNFDKKLRKLPPPSLCQFGRTFVFSERQIYSS